VCMNQVFQGGSLDSQGFKKVEVLCTIERPCWVVATKSHSVKASETAERQSGSHLRVILEQRKSIEDPRGRTGAGAAMSTIQS
jgi:hypothetical protein